MTALPKPLEGTLGLSNGYRTLSYHNIYATIGYERVVDGKTVTGSSVDWFGKSYGSKLEAIMKTEAQSALSR